MFYAVEHKWKCWDLVHVLNQTVLDAIFLGLGLRFGVG